MNDLSKEDLFKDLVTIKKGSVLFHEGENASYLYIIAKGKVQIVREDEDGIHSLGVVREKGFVGELSMFNDDKRHNSAICLDEAEVYIIKKSDIKKVLKDCPEWVTNLMVTLTDRLTDVNELMHEHRVVSSEIENEFNLDSVQKREIRDSLKAYRSRRGL